MLNNNSAENIEDNDLLGKKKSREEEPHYYSKEDSFNNYSFKNKYILNDIHLIKFYSKNLFYRLKNSPIEIINILVSPYTKFNIYFLNIYETLLNKIKETPNNHQKIIKYMYNNGTVKDEPFVLPSEIDNFKIINDIQKNENNENNEEINPNFITLNTNEICNTLKEYKWKGIIKILILFGDNGFLKQIIKNLDAYHNNYLIININKITKKEKSKFNNIINDIYSFDDIISYLKQDLYEYSIGKNKEIKEISDNYEQYNDLLKRYLNYQVNANIKANNPVDNNNYLYVNFYNKNNIIINKEEYALFDTNLSSKSYICQCYSSKIKKNIENNEIINFLNPEHVINKIDVELSISNNIYNIINCDNEENINILVNDLTLKKKMIGYINNKINKNLYNQEFFINNILLNYAICDYICDLFNMRLYENNININAAEINLYQCQNYILPYFICKEYYQSYKSKYNSELYESFSHFSYCISSGKILIENIKEINGKIYHFDIYKDKDNDEFDNEDNINMFRFFCYHKCNKYCSILKLNSIDKNFYDINPVCNPNIKNKRICEVCKIIFDINENKYDYKKYGLCLCFKCSEKISESKYERVCVECGNKIEYYYLLYILQKKETPNLCDKCQNEKNKNEIKSEEKDI
jgi:hypothetical protein